MDVTITRCGSGDIDAVVQFLHEHWKPNHILTRCRALLDWQYRNADGRGYSFLLARRSGSAEPIGILGYIATRRFDPALEDDNVVWLTTWKVRDDAGVAGLGLKLLQQLVALERFVAIGALGLNPETLPIYKALGYTTGELDHYARPNSRGAPVTLASIATHISTEPIATPIEARRLVTDDDYRVEWTGGRSESAPRKTTEYFRQRYARHPLYRYDVRALIDQTHIAGLLAMRVAEHEGRRALRIIDFSGSPDVFARAGALIEDAMSDHECEYADAYVSGITADALRSAGFVRIDPDGPDVVPDHFEPFERRNVRLFYAVKGRPTVLFKGESDQDRPNALPGATP